MEFSLWNTKSSHDLAGSLAGIEAMCFSWSALQIGFNSTSVYVAENKVVQNYKYKKHSLHYIKNVLL